MLIGSRAMKHWFSDAREPKDWDYFSNNPATVGDKFWHESFPAGWVDDTRIATPDELYTIKVSHSFWEVRGKWDRHMHDLLFLQSKGAKFVPEMYDILLPVWKQEHGKKRTNLKQSKDNFFADAVVRKYDHDSLHDSVAYGETPLYESILVEGEDVLTDWNKFLDMDYETQLKLVREEIYATALERILIPSDYLRSPGYAYHWALRRTCTSLFKGKWALWLVLHYQDLHRPDTDYLARHKSRMDRLILL